MTNYCSLEEKTCTVEENGTKKSVNYIAVMWHIGTQVIQLKAVYKSDKGAIKTLTMIPEIEFKKLSSGV